ncbi:uncharacterized protein LY79DRAFT_585454 [Colletotrichum navitas]|uniref:Uncharacterized protein n=1 Tax=Colletotrichum navitas TaxID=681940 RepID=A0AAD8PIE7_9PEZI|nr:uncharacterized protein LY79DRAFT_585454 [Colletotrichum navitas]KAK1561629.1 hypothetical protein LY79DRAFT_585454 [Colletotrichum navitas]
MYFCYKSYKSYKKNKVSYKTRVVKDRLTSKSYKTRVVGAFYLDKSKVLLLRKYYNKARVVAPFIKKTFYLLVKRRSSPFSFIIKSSSTKALYIRAKSKYYYNKYKLNRGKEYSRLYKTNKRLLNLIKDKILFYNKVLTVVRRLIRFYKGLVFFNFKSVLLTKGAIGYYKDFINTLSKRVVVYIPIKGIRLISIDKEELYYRIRLRKAKGSVYYIVIGNNIKYLARTIYSNKYYKVKRYLVVLRNKYITIKPYYFTLLVKID